MNTKHRLQNRTTSKLSDKSLPYIIEKQYAAVCPQDIPAAYQLNSALSPQYCERML